MIYVGLMNPRQLFPSYHFSYVENLTRGDSRCTVDIVYLCILYLQMLHCLAEKKYHLADLQYPQLLFSNP